jgi:hypothetical protein
MLNAFYFYCYILKVNLIKQKKNYLVEEPLHVNNHPDNQMCKLGLNYPMVMKS